MFIAREPMTLRRRSEERKVSRLVPLELSSAPPNGARLSYVPIYKHHTPPE